MGAAEEKGGQLRHVATEDMPTVLDWRWTFRASAVLYAGASTFVMVPAGGLLLGLSDLLLPVVGGAVAVHMLRTLEWTWSELLLLGYLGACLLSLFGSPVADEALPRVVRLVGISTPFFLARLAPVGPRDLREFLRWFVVGGAVSIAVGLVLFSQGIAVREGMQRFRFGPEVQYRALGVFGDSGAYGALWAIWLVVVVALWVKERRGFWGVAGLSGACALVTMAAYASLSRGAFFSVVLVLLTLPLASLVLGRGLVRWHVLLRWMFLVGIVAALGVAAWLLARDQARAILIERYLLSTFGAGSLDQATSGRLNNWASYLPYWNSNPITGVGYKNLILGYQLPPDNMYLSALVETGILGFLLMIAFIVSVLVGLVRRAKAGSYEALIMIFVWAVVLSIGLAVDVLTYWGVMPAVFFITGCVLATGRR